MRAPVKSGWLQTQASLPKGRQALSKQPAQQRRKAALQSKADKGKPAEILERPAQRCRQRAAQHGQQRDRIGVRNADALRRVDGLRYAERPARRTASVEQPARVMLLDVLFNVAAAAEGVVGYVQWCKAVHQQKYGSAEQRPSQNSRALRVDLWFSIPCLTGSNRKSRNNR